METEMNTNETPKIWAAAVEDRLYELVKPEPVTDSFVVRDEDHGRTFSELEEKFLKPCVEKLAKQLTRVGKVKVEMAYHVPTAGVEVTVTVM
jgi:hypothetical protein